MKKLSLLVLFLIGIIMFSSLASASWLTDFFSGGIFGRIVESQEGGTSATRPVFSCTDTDGGKDYFVQGTVTSIGGLIRPTTQTKTDECTRCTRKCPAGSSDPAECITYCSSVKEYFCSGTKSSSTIKVCKSGCQDGACLPELPECVKAGQKGPNPSLGPNDPNKDRICCDGLKLISPSTVPEGDLCKESVGGGTICSACGNGKCEKWENKCNCPEDCNSDICTKEYTPVCGQPPMSKCPEGAVCTMVMPSPKTYSNRCLLDAAGAEFLYDGACERTCNTDSDCPQIQCIKAPCPSSICVNGKCKIASEGDPPYCGAIGTRSEGWYDQTGLINYATCNGCVAGCSAAGTKSEGWYSSCDNSLIKWDNCASSSCTDTDGGKNYYVQGAVSILQLDIVSVEKVDECTRCMVPSTNGVDQSASQATKCIAVKEYYCTGNKAGETIFTCKNGCQDGACIKCLEGEYKVTSLVKGHYYGAEKCINNEWVPLSPTPAGCCEKSSCKSSPYGAAMCANPSSVFCGCMGGKGIPKTNDLGQYSMCQLSDGLNGVKEIEEWEYYRQNCDVVTIYSTT